jgi:hypothetical protein
MVQPMREIPKQKSLGLRFFDLKITVSKMCALLGYYAVSCGKTLATFRDNVYAPSSGLKKSWTFGLLPLKVRPTHCPETVGNGLPLDAE